MMETSIWLLVPPPPLCFLLLQAPSFLLPFFDVLETPARP